MFDHSGKFIVHYQLSEINCDAAFKHPQAVYHVDPCQRGEQPGECLFMPRLGVTDFAIALPTGRKTRQGIFAGQLGHSGGDHTAFRRPNRRRCPP